jgi:hypothetical protein
MTLIRAGDDSCQRRAIIERLRSVPRSAQALLAHGLAPVTFFIAGLCCVGMVDCTAAIHNHSRDCSRGTLAMG